MAFTYKPNTVINQMLLIVAKKLRKKPEQVLDEYIEKTYKIYG